MPKLTTLMLRDETCIIGILPAKKRRKGKKTKQGNRKGRAAPLVILYFASHKKCQSHGNGVVITHRALVTPLDGGALRKTFLRIERGTPRTGYEQLHIPRAC
jgi:hypothetical protein